MLPTKQSIDMLKQYISKIEQLQKYEEEIKQLRIQLQQQTQEQQDAEKLLSFSRDNGMDIAEVLQVINEHKIIIRSSQGIKYLVTKRKCINLDDLKTGTRVATTMSSLTIMHVLPPSVDAQVYSYVTSSDELKQADKDISKQLLQQNPEQNVEENNQQQKQDAKFSFADQNLINAATSINPVQLGIGGLGETLHTMYNTLLLPLTNPQLFKRLGIIPVQNILLYGPPGTGKTLICSKLAQLADCTFVKVVGSQLIQKYIGESSRIISEIFSFARRQERCIIMIDEIDSICTNRQDTNGSSSDKEVTRAMLTLLTELDGVKTTKKQPSCVFCTNRIKMLDKAFLRSGRIGEKIEIGLPNVEARYEIFQVHCKGVKFNGEISWKKLVNDTDGFNGADIRNVITEAGLHAIRQNRNSIEMKDLSEGVRIVRKGKEIEGRIWE